MRTIKLGDLKENEVYLFKENKLQKLEKPKTGFGKTILHWQDDKPVRVEINSSETIK